MPIPPEGNGGKTEPTSGELDWAHSCAPIYYLPNLMNTKWFCFETTSFGELAELTGGSWHARACRSLSPSSNRALVRASECRILPKGGAKGANHVGWRPC